MQVVVGLNMMGVTGRVVKEREMIVGLEWAMSKVAIMASMMGQRNYFKFYKAMLN